MSVALPGKAFLPFNTPGLHNQVQFHIDIPIFVNRITALKIYNESPYQLIFTNIPGSMGAYLSDWLEDVFIIPSDSIQFPGQLQFFTQIDQYPNDPTSAGYIWITIYEEGDSIPRGYPIYHTKNTYLYQDIPRASTLYASSDVAAAAAGSVTLSAPDSGQIQFYTCVAGISIEIDHAGTRVTFAVATLTGIGLLGGAGMKFRIDVEASTSTRQEFVRIFPSPIISTNRGQASNTVTFSVPATVGGPAYTMNIWGYPLGTPLDL